MAVREIQYLGHSTCIIRAGNQAIIIDPWLDGNPLCPETCKKPEGITVIILTHGHADHTASAAQVAKATGATLFATYELAMLMAKEGVPESQLQPMNKGGTVRHSSGISLTLTHALHSSSFDASDGHTYYAGEACGAVISLSDGSSIYHAGDTCYFSDMKIIRELYQPTIALLPIGDRFTMGPVEAAQAAEAVGAAVAIPIHHSTFPLLTGTPAQFTDALADSSINVIPLKPGERWEW